MKGATTVVLLVGFLALPATNRADSELLDSQERPIETRPYRVFVDVHVSRALEGDRYARELGECIQRSWGAVWAVPKGEEEAAGRFPVFSNRLKQVRDFTDLSELTYDEVAEEFGDSGWDKTFVVVVAAATEFRERIAVREFDASLRLAGAPVVEQRVTPLTRVVRGEAALRRAFSPLALIEETEGGVVPLRIQGAELGQARLGIAPGDVYEPFLRVRDPQTGGMRRIQDIPWTLLEVVEQTRARAKCRLLTGVRSPLSQKMVRRVEHVARRVQTSQTATRLELRQGGRPAVGFRVVVRPPVKWDAESEIPDPVLTAISDRRGSISLSVESGHAPVWVSVIRGAARLARVPIVPGAVEQIVLPLPDDRLRLDVEGRLALLEGDVIDLVARRSLLLSRARRAAQAGDQAKMEAWFGLIRKLGGLKEVSQRLRTIRVSGIQAARDAGDRVAERSINRQCDKILGVVRQYLDEVRTKDALDEIEELLELKRETEAVEKASSDGA